MARRKSDSQVFWPQAVMLWQRLKVVKFMLKPDIRKILSGIEPLPVVTKLKCMCSINNVWYI